MDIDERLTDDALVARITDTALAGRRNLADLVALLIEVEDRRLHLARGHSSLFGFCCEALRFSEGEAGNRVAAVHAARRFPVILALLRDGEINLTTVRLLAPHLTPDNHVALLDSARGKGRVQVEQIVVSLAPRPVVAPTLRAVTPLPVTAPLAAAPLPRPQPVVTPIAPELFRLSVTMTAETRELWNRLRELVHGDDAQVLARAVAAAVRVLEQQKYASTDRPALNPRPTAADSRHVPAEVRRQVERRDGERCAFRGRGHRCNGRRFLEFHHVKPWMAGGATTVENVELRCRAHNQYEADLFYGTVRRALVPDQRHH